MKKFFAKAALMLLVCLSLSTVAFAGEFGSIDAMDEIVTPEAEGAVVVTTIKATTDADGKLAYPKNGEIISTEVTSGTVVGDWVEESKGTLSYYVIQFAEKESEVAMTVTSKVTDAYTLKAAKAASTSIKGVNTLTYKMSNTSPIKISGYVVAVSILYLYKERHLLKVAAEKKIEEKERKAAEKAKNAAEREAAKAAKLKK